MEEIKRTMLYVNSAQRMPGGTNTDCTFRFPGAILMVPHAASADQYLSMRVQLDAIHVPLNLQAARQRNLRILKLQSSLNGGAYAPNGPSSTLAELCVAANLYDYSTGPLGYAYLSFRTVDPVQASLHLNQRSIDTLRLWLTDQNDVPLDDNVVNEAWHAKFAVVTQRDTGAEANALLKELSEYTRLSLIGQHYNNSSNTSSEAQAEHTRRQQRQDVLIGDMERMYREVLDPAAMHETVLNPHEVMRRSNATNTMLDELSSHELSQLPRGAFFSADLMTNTN